MCGVSPSMGEQNDIWSNKREREMDREEERKKIDDKWRANVILDKPPFRSDS